MTQHPDRPAGVEEIESYMHELMRSHRLNCWHLGGLYKWLSTRPDSIWQAIEELKASFGELPQELIQLDEAFVELSDLQATSYCGLSDLNKWLETYPDIIFTATERLENRIDEMFPPLTILAEEAHGDVYPHYHQAV